MKQALYLAALTSFLLSACGGGSSDTGAAAVPVANVAVTPAAPTTADCHETTAGIQFTTTEGNRKIVNVTETFEGATAFGRVELRPDGNRMDADYRTISGGMVHLLGYAEYDMQGVYDGKSVYSGGAQYPLTMTAGQSVSIRYVDTHTFLNFIAPVVRDVSSELTFVGFENLTLGGRTFLNVCKFKNVDNVSNMADLIWVAKGFGMIRYQQVDAQGVAVSNTIELNAIISAP